MSLDRRRFIQNITVATAGLALAPDSFAVPPSKKPFFEISLAEWSLHKALFGKEITNLDFPGIARKKYGISVVEYVNQFFKDKATDTSYLAELMTRCKDNGVKNHLIMVDGEGALADLNDATRLEALEKHYKWVDAAKYLGCRTVRVNAAGTGTKEEVHKAAVDGLSRLGEYGAKAGLNIIVENHGGITSDGGWLSGVMKEINMNNVGTLPDFGNFCIKRGSTGQGGNKCIEEYDKYKGVQELMPFAKGVSAKTFDFDASGACVETDYTRMLGIVKKAGFKGYLGIEYEGDKLSEDEGIRKTKALLEKVGAAMG